MKEVVGFDGAADHADPVSESRQEHQHEIETKLILSSDAAGWNFSENLIAEKNLADEPWELGYAVGMSRPLRLEATPDPCVLCRENFAAGVELYGGAGTVNDRTFSSTSHYLAPVISWRLPSGSALTLSPAWGLTGESHRFVLRFGVSHEIVGLWGR